MKNIYILVPETAVPDGVTGPRYLFDTANQFLGAAGKDSLFKVQLVGQKREIRVQNGAYTIHTDRLLSDSGQADLLIVPPIFGDMASALALNQAALPWIVDQARQGAEVASLCVGAVLLASSGLINVNKCSTHLACYEVLQEMIPAVE